MADIAIYTVGHSTRTLEQLRDLVLGAGVSAIADVRIFPSSRRHPHFNREALERWLPDAGIQYVHFSELGGRRNPAPDSPNGGWRERGFRGYADYMVCGEFEAGLQRLERLSAARPTAIMCAEALWWRCHRRLIADALTVRGADVVHLGAGEPVEHQLTPFAEVGETGTLTYPPAQSSLGI